MQAKEVSCLYLMHPRLSTADSMEGFACHAIADWNNRLREGRVSVSQQNRGLIAVAFDQRNHGSRLVDKLSNCAWKEGNPKHAQDMFATYRRCTTYFPSIFCWRSEIIKYNHTMLPYLSLSPVLIQIRRGHGS